MLALGLIAMAGCTGPAKKASTVGEYQPVVPAASLTEPPIVPTPMPRLKATANRPVKTATSEVGTAAKNATDQDTEASDQPSGDGAYNQGVRSGTSNGVVRRVGQAGRGRTPQGDDEGLEDDDPGMPPTDGPMGPPPGGPGGGPGGPGGPGGGPDDAS